MQLTIREICEATGGDILAVKKSDYLNINDDISVSGVSTDSRGDVAGRLFVPISGPSFDGHDYIYAAISKGAVCSLTEREHKGETYPLIKVASTRQALMDLAAYDRMRFAGSVVAITGSAGKTTTKEIIASVLSKKFETLKTQGNLNNDIGLPLTLLSRDDAHETMVLEMGMNHLGEISVLSRLGKPDICLITNIGDAHIENLGSREGILRAKSEIFEGLRQGGMVVLNGDDILLSKLPRVTHAGKTVYCTLQNKKDGNWVSAEGIKSQGLRGTSCNVSWQIEDVAKWPAGSINIQIPLPGDHMVMNALMSFAVGLELGLSPWEISGGIKDFTPAGHRMAITEVNGMIIVNDSYNASPPSMEAAIDMLSSIDGRKVCILGDMFELGDHAEAMHKAVGEYAAVKKIDILITIGTLSRYMYEAFPQEKSLHYLTKEAFLAEWQSHLKAGDVILIKASRGMALEYVAEEISKI